MQTGWHIVMYTAVPVATAIAGGLVAALWPPAPTLRSRIQHFAAGVVFAALGVELLPDVMHRHAPAAAAAGFAVGVALMLLVRALARGGRDEEDEADDRGARSGAAGYLLAVGVDVLIDGVLLGIGFAAGRREGKMLAVALAAEFLSLGLANSATLVRRGSSRGRAIAINSGLALLPVAGVLAGVLLLSRVSGAWMEALLAFATAALLYLVTEELLVEAHEVPETPLTTATFFVGFLGMMLLDMLSG